MGILIIVGIVALLALVVVGVYNKYIKLKNLNQEGWSGVEVYLQKRWDLIPNIVETVKGYATHERETFESVTRARTSAIQAQDVKTQEVAENQLSGALMRLMAISERYPELKSNQNFI